MLPRGWKEVTVGSALKIAGIILLACLTISLSLAVLVAGPWMAWRLLDLDGLLACILFCIELVIVGGTCAAGVEAFGGEG
jgi:hypothetical protein